MAYQDFGPAFFPNLWVPPPTQNFVIDASGEKVGFIFEAPASGNITGLSIATASVTTGDTLLISLQDVDATDGDPDETADQSVTQVVDSADDNTKFDVTLGAARTVTRGDVLACVIEFNSFVAGNMQIRGVANNSGALAPVLKNRYVTHKTGGTWTKSTSAAPLLAVNYGGTYHPISGLLPPLNTTVAFNSGSTPDERALYFTPTVPMKVDAIMAYVDVDEGVDFVLYDTDGSTVLGTASLDKDIRSSNILGPTIGVFSAAVELAAGSTYRAAVKPTTTTNITLAYVDVGTAAILAQLGCGSGQQMSHRSDAGSWTEVTDERPAIFLRATAFDDGTGGGGGAVLPPGSLSGGIFQ